MIYFLIDTYIDSEKGRGSYDEYIEKVKPIVESFGGTYILRSERIRSLSPERTPQRVIIIRFQDREHMENCFDSEEYKEIMGMRISSVDARAIIAEEDESWE
ncbi:MAG: DUF1330 domain-containing protein [Lachnospiraceae bacterium]